MKIAGQDSQSWVLKMKIENVSRETIEKRGTGKNFFWTIVCGRVYNKVGQTPPTSPPQHL